MSWFNTGFLLPILIIVGVNLEYNGGTTLQDHSQQLNVSEVDNALLPSCRIWSDLDYNSSTPSSVVYDSCDVGSVSLSDQASSASTASDMYHFVNTDFCGNGDIVAKVDAPPVNGVAGIEIREHDGAGARKLQLYTNYSNVQRVSIRQNEGQLTTVSNHFTPGASAVWVKITRNGNWLFAYVSTTGFSWTYVHGVFMPSLSNCLKAGLSVQNNGGASSASVNYSQVSITDGGLPDTEVSFSQSTAIDADAGDTIQVCLDIANSCGACVPTSVEVALTSASGSHLSNYSTETVTFNDGNDTKCFDLIIGNQSGNETYTLGLQNISGGSNAQIVTPSSLTINVEGASAPPTELVFSQLDTDAEPGETVNICVDMLNECTTCPDVTAEVVLTTSNTPHLTTYNTTTLTFDNGSIQECVTVVVGNDDSAEDYTFGLQNITGGNSTGIGTPANANLHVVPPTKLVFNQPDKDAEPGETVNICVDMLNECTTCPDVTAEVVLTTSNTPHLTTYNTTTLTFDNGSTQECVTVVVGSDDSAEDYTFGLQNIAGGNNTEVGIPSTMDLHVMPATELVFSMSDMDAVPGETVNICVDMLNECTTCPDVTAEVVLTTSSTPHLTTYNTTMLTFDNGSVQECVTVVVGNDNSAEDYTFGLQNITGGFNTVTGIPPTMDLHVEPVTKLVFNVSDKDAEPGETVNICVDMLNECTTCPDVTAEVVLTTSNTPHLTTYNTTTLTFDNGSLQECVTVVVGSDDSAQDYTFGLQNIAGGNNTEVGIPSTMDLHVMPATELVFSVSDKDAKPGETVNICVDMLNECATCPDVTAEVVLTTSNTPHLTTYNTTMLTFDNGSVQECVTVVVGSDESAEDYTFGLQNIVGGFNTVTGIPPTMDLHVEPVTKLVFNVSDKDAEPGETVNICVDMLNECTTCPDVTAEVVLTTSNTPHLTTYNTTTLTFDNGSVQECVTVVVGSDDSAQDYTFGLQNITGGNNTEVGTVPTMDLHVMPATELVFSVSDKDAEPGETVNICVDMLNDCTSCPDVTAEVVLTTSNTPHLTTYNTTTLTFDNGSIQECVTVVVGSDNSVEDYTFGLQNITGGFNTVTGTPPTMDLHVMPATELVFSVSDKDAEPGETVNICVDMLNECTTCTDVTAEVVLTTSNTPHLTTYNTTMLTFDNGSIQECVTVVVGSDDSAKDYTFGLQNITGGFNTAAGTPPTMDLHVMPATELVFSVSEDNAEPGETVNICVDMLNECTSCPDVTAEVVLTTSNTPHLTTYNTTTLTFDNGSVQECVTVVVGSDNSVEDYTFGLQNIAGGFNTVTGTPPTMDLHVMPSTELVFSVSDKNAEPGETVNICVDMLNECTTCPDVTAEVVLTTSDMPHLTNYNTTMLTFDNGSVQECVTVVVGSDDSAEDYTFGLQNITGGHNAAPGVPPTMDLHVMPATELVFSASTVGAQPGETVNICADISNFCTTCPDVSVEVILTTGASPHLTDYNTTLLTFDNGSDHECVTVVVGNDPSSNTYTFGFQNITGGFNTLVSGTGETVLQVQNFSPDDLLGCVLFPDLKHCESNVNADGTPPDPPIIDINCNQNDPNFGVLYPWVCDPDDRYKGVSNIFIDINTIVNQSTVSTTTVSSNGLGFFGDIIQPGMIEMIPSYDGPYDAGTDPWVDAVNGINSYDISKVSKYVNEIGDLCPLSRIAADVNYDGMVTQQDADLMRDVLLMNQLNFGNPHWRFVPLPYVYPNPGHNDPTFLADFWQSSMKDDRGFQYPFNAILNFNGKSYTYSGTGNSDSWMDMLHEWPYDTPEACGETKWGFYLIKLGEMTSNAYTGNGSIDPPSPMQLINEYELDATDREAMPSDNPPLEFLIRVSAQAAEPVASYQIGLKIDTALIDISEIRPREEMFNQELESNFGVLPVELAKGNFRTVWINDFSVNEVGLSLEEPTMLFEFVVQLEPGNLPTLQEIMDALSMQQDVLPTAFYTTERQIEDVELFFEIEAL